MTETIQKCRECGERLPLSAFYKHPNGQNERDTKCKGCVKAYAKSRRAENPELYRERDRLRSLKPHSVLARKQYRERMRKDADARARFSEQTKKWAERNKAQRKANIQVGNALRDGVLVRPDSCSQCNVECKPTGHHEDYRSPMDVTWLCLSCHGKRHREINEEIRTGKADKWAKRGFNVESKLT